MNRLRAYTGAAGALAILALAGCGGSADGGSTAPLAIVDTNPPSVISTTTRAAVTTAPTTTTPTKTTPTKTTTTATAKSTTPKKTISTPPTADASGYEGAGGFYYFTSPTGKFECGIIITESSIAGCHGELPPTAPRVDDASAARSKVTPNTIELTAGSPARFLSSGDPRFHRFEGTARALPYDEKLSIPGSGSTNGLTCSISMKAGVTCLDQVGHGFTVSDSAFEVK